GCTSGLTVSFTITDYQVNTVEKGSDINVTGVWQQGITGKGIIVAIVDDGLDDLHEDLKDAFYAAGSYDFNDHTALPRPRLSDDTHGTRCAGEIAARRNQVCGVGVAYDARVAGIRILSAEITDADEAEALNYGYQENHIYSCSWGPPDDGQSADAPQGVILQAMINGIQNGRNGSGTIFVFASGNGGASDDNCNFDGYTNSIYTITVGAVDRLEEHPFYAERCSAQLVVTYSSGSGSYIYTTDVGQGKCTQRHGGTSAAAPIAAGVFALVLSVRPDLTWRDMQHLCVQTAVFFNPNDDEWQLLPSGRRFNHKYGYGKLDAFRIVEAAKTYKNVGPQVRLEMPVKEIELNIPETDVGLVSVIQVEEESIDKAALGRLEHVTVTVNIEHQRRGDLEIYLVSPNEIVSELAPKRKFDQNQEGLKNWTFMTVKHWEENPVGNWTLHVLDRSNLDSTGRFIDWQIKFWGERDPAFVGEPNPTPLAGDASPVTNTNVVTHTSVAAIPSSQTSTAAVSSAAQPTASTSHSQSGAPKPSGLEEIEEPQKVSSSASSSNSHKPTQGVAQDDDTASSNVTSNVTSTDGPSQRGGSFFFYAVTGSGLIVVAAGIAYLTKRRFLDTSRIGSGSSGGPGGDGYEFEVLTNEPDDGIGGDHLSNTPMLGRGRGRRDSEEMKEMGERYRDDDEQNVNGNVNGNGNANGNGNGYAKHRDPKGKGKKKQTGKVEVMFDRSELDDFLEGDDEAPLSRDPARPDVHVAGEFVGGNQIVLTPPPGSRPAPVRDSSWEDFTPLVKAHEDV
ncbi:subtilase, partial [Jimgerdemannia flammicorona]